MLKQQPFHVARVRVSFRTRAHEPQSHKAPEQQRNTPWPYQGAKDCWHNRIVPRSLTPYFPGVIVYSKPILLLCTCIHMEMGQLHFFPCSLTANQQLTNPSLRARERERQGVCVFSSGLKPSLKLVLLSAQVRFRVLSGVGKEVQVEKEEVLHFIFLEQAAPAIFRAAAYIYTHLYIILYMYMYNHLHTCIKTYSHTYIHTYIHAYIHTHIHSYICVCTHIHTHIFVFRGEAGLRDHYN